MLVENENHAMSHRSVVRGNIRVCARESQHDRLSGKIQRMKEQTEGYNFFSVLLVLNRFNSIEDRGEMQEETIRSKDTNSWRECFADPVLPLLCSSFKSVFRHSGRKPENPLFLR